MTATEQGFGDWVRASFAQQGVMELIGAELSELAPGRCEIRLPFRDDLTQQDGFFHAGITSTIADSAGGYAAYSLMPEDSRVLTVEYKVNLLAPAHGELLIAQGHAVKSGRTLAICDVTVEVEQDGQRTLCAKMLQTLMCLYKQ
ncbi:MAG: PaaI family thioesterase [Gammaproteobacteria bacterium]|nr:PaaI family thioesterase [Gammaproteobacteria bacterium]MDH3466112.1 PaaI family thioesterase [Gammaproteobacteria bacterium]